MRIGIIGGKGKMGSALAAFFKDADEEVWISDRGTKISNRELAKKCDVIIVSVPIDQTVGVIEEIAPHVRKEGLLMDLTSLKEAPIQAMLKSKASVIGAHPMCNETTFGPGQTLLYCPVRPGKWLPWFKSTFGQKAKFKLIPLTPKKHDEAMAYVQTLSHFPEFVLGRTLSKLSPHLAKLLEVASPASKLKWNMAARHLAQDPNLYGNIQIQNSNTPEILKAYVQSTQELYDIVAQKDLKHFVRYFNAGKKFFGAYGKVALHETDRLIHQLVPVPEPENPKKFPQKALGVLGPVWSQTYLAGKHYLAKNKIPLVAFNTIEEVFSAVEKGKIAQGIVPLENRLHGTVRETHDALFEKKVYITEELRMPIHHCSAILPGSTSKQIKTIMSHPQALHQCSRYLKKNFPKAQWVSVTSTSAAFEYVKKMQDPTIMVIGTEEAAAHFGFKILKTHSENDSINSTDFIVIRKKPKQWAKNPCKTSIVFYFNENKPGSLFKVFKIFAELGINLSRMESRPAPKELGEYLFYIDFEESVNSLRGKNAMKEVKKAASGMKLLGCYTVRSAFIISTR